MAGITVGGAITAAAGLFSIGSGIGSWVSEGLSTSQRIAEARDDYKAAMKDIDAQVADAEAEATRQIANTKAEGIATLKEQGAQSEYETKIATIQAEQTAQSAEAAIATSGVKQKGSPLLVAQQQADLAFAEAQRVGESGQAAMKIGGLKLGTSLQNIEAEKTLLTKELQRQRAELYRKKEALKDLY
jgi:hypothetical protein